MDHSDHTCDESVNKFDMDSMFFPKNSILFGKKSLSQVKIHTLVPFGKTSYVPYTLQSHYNTIFGVHTNRPCYE